MHPIYGYALQPNFQWHIHQLPVPAAVPALAGLSLPDSAAVGAAGGTHGSKAAATPHLTHSMRLTVKGNGLLNNFISIALALNSLPPQLRHSNLGSISMLKRHHAAKLGDDDATLSFLFLLHHLHGNGLTPRQEMIEDGR